MAAISFGLSLWSQPQLGVFVLLCLFLLSIMYFFLGFFLMQGLGFADLNEAARKKQLSIARTIGSAGLGIGMSALLLGIMFQIQLWTGGAETLLMGLGVCGVALGIVVFKWTQGKEVMYRNLMIRLLLALSIGLVFFFVSPYTWQKVRHRNDVEFVQALEKAEANPEDEAAMKELFELQRARQEAKRKQGQATK
ncbi:MAG: hypothetical protein AAF399_16640 [Bacteroidota bacterium]